MIMQLNDRWTLVRENANLPCQVPFSVYDTLVKAGEIPDPYDRENEWISTPVSDRDYLFEKRFTPDPALAAADRVLLRFDGVDTLAEIFLNGERLGACDNMHRVWTFSVRPLLRSGENVLRVRII